jgi:catechol 2,3-dioxygenase-like lactoylglutathione lyase family enzyme
MVLGPAQVALIPACAAVGADVIVTMTPTASKTAEIFRPADRRTTESNDQKAIAASPRSGRAHPGRDSGRPFLTSMNGLSEFRQWPDRRAPPVIYAGAVHLGLVAIVVSEYDPAITFFVDVLGFELVEDSPSLTNDGRPKRWVVVRPPGAVTGLLLAQADGEDQAAAVGRQAAGRVGFFLHVEDFDVAYARMSSAGVEFATAPRTEPYGQVAVFLDVAGNKWDLIGPARPD